MITVSLVVHTVISWRWTSRCLHIRYTDSTWAFTSLADNTCRSGSLVRARYRSSWLLVLEFETDKGTRFTEDFWQDGVSESVFSRLHFASLYGIESASSERTSLSRLFGLWSTKDRCDTLDGHR